MSPTNWHEDVTQSRVEDIIMFRLPCINVMLNIVRIKAI